MESFRQKLAHTLQCYLMQGFLESGHLVDTTAHAAPQQIYVESFYFYFLPKPYPLSISQFNLSPLISPSPTSHQTPTPTPYHLQLRSYACSSPTFTTIILYSTHSACSAQRCKRCSHAAPARPRYPYPQPTLLSLLHRISRSKTI